ncbi:hypothetical protein [Indioceanicola profundi]|uniref:hypothetical protein n=1 Tax=Indioceanicola profundi TaxID=2220096 RepID=UPI000E6ADA29|nr:hypothetical protein [Indioceanicola profundi]
MERCILEIEGEEAGVLVRDGSAYRFFAAGLEAAKLDGRTFPNLRKAESAVRQTMMGVKWRDQARR